MNVSGPGGIGGITSTPLDTDLHEDGVDGEGRTGTDEGKGPDAPPSGQGGPSPLQRRAPRDGADGKTGNGGDDDGGGANGDGALPPGGGTTVVRRNTGNRGSSDDERATSDAEASPESVDGAPTGQESAAPPPASAVYRNADAEGSIDDDAAVGTDAGGETVVLDGGTDRVEGEDPETSDRVDDDRGTLTATGEAAEGGVSDPLAEADVATSGVDASGDVPVGEESDVAREPASDGSSGEVEAFADDEGSPEGSNVDALVDQEGVSWSVPDDLTMARSGTLPVEIIEPLPDVEFKYG